MFELNPLANPDAFWQHIVMLVVAVILGYLIGLVSGKKEISSLENELSRIDSDLSYCRTQKTILKKAVSKQPLEVIALTQQDIQHDDLKIIEGIGPKIESVLKQAGIHSFRQLSQKQPEQISSILLNADARLQIHDTTTWPRQAALAADGNWDQLKTWQDELNGGRVE